MIKQFLLYSVIALMVSGCIGDDLVFDAVDEQLRISNIPDSLGIGDEFQVEFRYTNEVGLEEQIDVTWSSSNTEVLEIDQNGIARGIAAGRSIITVASNVEPFLEDTSTVVVGDETVLAEVSDRTGQLTTTSSYVLEGGFTLSETSNGLVLSFGADYQTTSALPGLYIYLTNNPNTTNGAHEIGEVTTFSGAHSYDIDASVAIDQYSHVLYFCKPFAVKVGEGEFDN